jgi:predicted kinase
MVVLSGAPGTGKTTLGHFLSGVLELPFLSLDVIKESLADALGTVDEDWSDRLGDAAAEVVFRLAAMFPRTVVDGWWRGDRRARAQREFVGCVEIFVRCEPTLAEERMRARHLEGRHAIHRDVINPSLLDRTAHLVEIVEPLGVGSLLIEVDTTQEVDRAQLLTNLDDAFSLNTEFPG